MINQVYGDIFMWIDITADYKKSAICIPTNGCTNINGDAIMDKGVAKTAKSKYKNIHKILGKYIKHKGNHVYCLGVGLTNVLNSYKIFSFPTKNHWKDKSDINLIKQSCIEIKKYVDTLGIKACYIPIPDCDCDGLDYESQVKPVLEEILDDRFFIINLE